MATKFTIMCSVINILLGANNLQFQGARFSIYGLLMVFV